MFRKTPSPESIAAMLVVLTYVKPELLDDRINALPKPERQWLVEAANVTGSVDKRFHISSAAVSPANVAKSAATLAQVSPHRTSLMLDVIARAAVIQTSRVHGPEDQNDKNSIATAFDTLAQEHITKWRIPGAQVSTDHLLSDVHSVVAKSRGKVALQTTDNTANLVFS